MTYIRPVHRKCTNNNCPELYKVDQLGSLRVNRVTLEKLRGYICNIGNGNNEVDWVRWWVDNLPH